MRDENGFYYYKGRADDMFTFKGKNVYPAEIENALMDHPDIACAVVFPVKDVMRENLAIAAVEPTGDADLTEADVKDIHRNSNGDLPRLTRVIVLPKIPLLSNGKPDLHRLRTLANHCQQQSNSR